MENKNFTWIKTYQQLANAIYAIRDTPEKLTSTLASIFDGTHGVTFPTCGPEPFESSQVDPFTFFASFNRGITDKKRQSIIALAAKELGLRNIDAPGDFTGIPLANSQQSWFIGGKEDRDIDDVDNLWGLFCAAIEYADNPNNETKYAFIDAYDTASNQYLISWKITMGLFWVRPNTYMTLDSRSRDYLSEMDAFDSRQPFPSGKEYLAILDRISIALSKTFPQVSLDAYEWSNANKRNEGWWPEKEEYDPGISTERWSELLADEKVFDKNSLSLMKRMLSLGGSATCKELSSQFGRTYNYHRNIAMHLAQRVANATKCEVITSDPDSKWWPILFVGKHSASTKKGSYIWKIRPELENALSDFDLSDIPLHAARYWCVAPGDGASSWEAFRKEGILAIGWKDLGDPLIYKSKAALKEALAQHYGKSNPKNDGLSIWRFTQEIKPGDIVFARKGKTQIVGRGIVRSECRYEPQREHYATIRDVEWTHVGTWDVDGKMQWQTVFELTDNSPHTPDELEALVNGETQEIRHWWLNANASIWSFSQFNIGQETDYTLYNEQGHPRRILSNFKAARKGDIIVGYETKPTGKIIALCEVTKPADDERICFAKKSVFEKPISYEEVKADPILSQCEFCKNPNGSFFKLSKTEFDRIIELSEPVIAPYSDGDFLQDVYLDEEGLSILKALLLRKKNLILQGAPGTGKTYAAKRLAYVMMGSRDDSRIELVQFHQSTTYEDFVIGYRPTPDGGFEIREGIFTRFCKRAAADPDRQYFFIIDEINRANISKVLGELLMLIEADHRGESIALPLNETTLVVPKNLYLIGMMNTADRGLALIDYALRRRFAFFDMKPAFSNDRFRAMIESVGNPKLIELLSKVETLNIDIASDPSLGPGFCIGHSYFCTDDTISDRDVHSIVRYEIEPLIGEYWFDDPEKVKSQVDKLESIF